MINNELYSPIAPLEVLRFDYQQPVQGLPTAVGVPADGRIGWLVLAMLVVAVLCRRRVRDAT